MVYDIYILILVGCLSLLVGTTPGCDGNKPEVITVASGPIACIKLPPQWKGKVQPDPYISISCRDARGKGFNLSVDYKGYFDRWLMNRGSRPSGTVETIVVENNVWTIELPINGGCYVYTKVDGGRVVIIGGVGKWEKNEIVDIIKGIEWRKKEADSTPKRNTGGY